MSDQVEHELSGAVILRFLVAEGAEAQLGALQIRQNADGALDLRLDGADRAVSSSRSLWLVWLMLMRNTSAPAMNNFSIISGLDDAGPRVAMILTLRFLRT